MTVEHENISTDRLFDRRNEMEKATITHHADVGLLIELHGFWSPEAEKVLRFLTNTQIICNGDIKAMFHTILERESSTHYEKELAMMFMWGMKT